MKIDFEASFRGRSAYPYEMPMHTRSLIKRGGFTLVELLVVIAIIILLMGILIPSVSFAYRSAKTRQDMIQVGSIYKAMALHATSDEGRLPLPSRIANEKNPDPTLNTTSALMSWLVMQRYFNFEATVSPVETNPNIRPIKATDGSGPVDGYPYNFEIYDGDQFYWDPDFNADFMKGPAHSSYAHQALVGQRLRLKWHTGAGSTDIIVSNRGPELEMTTTSLLVLNPATTYTFGFHGSSDAWEGAAVSGDGSTKMLKSYVPENVTYSPLDGSLLRPDILFATEFIDVDDNPMSSGDNWIIVTSNVNDAFTANNTAAVWD